jgi:recombination protein RecR
MKYPITIRNLIECFKKLPGIGEKTAERYALAILELDDEVINLFAESLINVKKRIKRCEKCHNLTEEQYCDICKDPTRDQQTICVVEESKNIMSFEKAGTYYGTYHVLDGLISPLDGINPEDINLKTLMARIETENIKEIIIATKPCIEGETTSLYIAKKLKDTDVKVSKIAYGIPLGADMGYVDPMTLEISLENRQQIS